MKLRFLATIRVDLAYLRRRWCTARVLDTLRVEVHASQAPCLEWMIPGIQPQYDLRCLHYCQKDCRRIVRLSMFIGNLQADCRCIAMSLQQVSSKWACWVLLGATERLQSPNGWLGLIACACRTSARRIDGCDSPPSPAQL